MNTILHTLLVPPLCWMLSMSASIGETPTVSTTTFVVPDEVGGSIRIVHYPEHHNFTKYPWDVISPGSDYNVCDDCVIYLQLQVQRMELLRQLQNKVFFLSLRFQSVADTDLIHIRHLSSIRMLDLAFTGITDKSYEVINLFKQLESLDVTETKVTDKFLSSLDSGLPLSRFQMSSTEISDQGLTQICIKYPNLTVLSLPSTISDVGFPSLAQLDHIKRLFCSNCKVTDHTVLEVLKSMHNLEVLSLDGTGVTERVFDSLAHLSHLRLVKLPSSIPLESIKAFRRNQPQVTIITSMN